MSSRSCLLLCTTMVVIAVAEYLLDGYHWSLGFALAFLSLLSYGAGVRDTSERYAAGLARIAKALEEARGNIHDALETASVELRRVLARLKGPA